MNCGNCGNQDAEVTLTEIENNEMKTLHLCSTCAAQKGVSTTSPGSPPIADLLAHLRGVEEGGATTDAEECEYCGMQSREVRKTGRLGCPQCYAQFPEQLRALLRRVHGASEHIGKVYVSATVEGAESALELATLKRRLERAVEIEDFELAADLRDQMHAIGDVP